MKLEKPAAAVAVEETLLVEAGLKVRDLRVHRTAKQSHVVQDTALHFGSAGGTEQLLLEAVMVPALGHESAKEKDLDDHLAEDARRHTAVLD